MSWIAIEDYEGLYAVSDEGDVMSMNYAKSGLPGLMTQTLRRGYPSVFFRKRDKGRWFTVHTLVAKAFIGPRPDGHDINHIDGVKMHNARTNLEYVTKSENQKHACKLLLIDNRGESHSQSKLAEEQVIEIIEALSNGEKNSVLTKKYDIDPAQISHIKNGTAWRHLDRKAG